MNSAVLLIIFNRPHLTSKVFERIRKAQPPRLYVAADGPRDTRPDDVRLCGEAREVVSPDWPCDVVRLFQNENLGCRRAVSGALDWFFEHEAEGIILEDDCLPAESFFPFCDTLLAVHRHDETIARIFRVELHWRKACPGIQLFFLELSRRMGVGNVASFLETLRCDHERVACVPR